VDIKIVARLPEEILCICRACSAEFSIKPGPPPRASARDSA
jgi:hypothetical protein